MENSEFLSLLSGKLDGEQYLWVCSYVGDPNSPAAAWDGRAYHGKPAQAQTIDRCRDQNTYVSTAVLSGLDDQARFRRSKLTFLRLAVLVADDCNPDDLVGQVSYVIETSPGKRQIGVWLDVDDPDCVNGALIDAVMGEMSAAGFMAKADISGNNRVRYVRLPVGSNLKPRDSGPWAVRLEQSNPEARYSLADACAVFGIDLDRVRAGMSAPKVRQHNESGSDHASLIALLTADNVDERSYHDPLLKLTGKLVAGGLHPGAVVEHVRGIMMAHRPASEAELARWRSRYAEIPRMVAGAERHKQRVDAAAEDVIPVPAPATAGLLLTLTQLEEAAKSVRWCVKALIPADSMGILFGASGTFKSFLALDLCLHLAHDMSWCGRKTNAGGVVYVAAEGGAGISRRVSAWHKQNKRMLATNFAVCVTPLLLTVEERIVALRDAISALTFKPSLIVVDTLSQTFAGDENSASDISDYLRLINLHLRSTFGASVLVIHHTGHSASERPRGSSALTANVDYLLGVYRPDTDGMSAQLEVLKQKDGDKLLAQHFDLTKIVLGRDEDGDEVSSLVAGWYDSVKVVRDAVNKLSVYEQMVIDALSDGLVLREDELRALFVEGNAGTQRQAWRRTMDKLQQRRLIKAAGIKEWRKV